MQKANETRMERQFPDRCKPCYCNKSFGQYIENHFYACDIEYGYGLIAVYRRKGKGYHKTTFDESIFKQHIPHPGPGCSAAIKARNLNRRG